ncbi:putative phage tail protein [Aristophania vespae]|uniref:putative phage tail protein n=1 Tax=Aristophania vespae TaxID=2697033 RepID=UPI002351662B|nr:putative phage tail protein [Aristophania vespae]UMM63835.1 hypothetical protein DM15PD_08120 [Aristophania vespae]
MSIAPPRSAAEIAEEWHSDLLPGGPAWHGPNIKSLMHALALPRETLEGDIASIATEICPGTAHLLLDDYRDVLGTDPLGRDENNLTDDEWRALLQQRWTARGNQRPDFYKELAQKLGCDIKLWEPDAPLVGGTICGTKELAAPSVAFQWIVILPDETTDEQARKIRQFFNFLKPADSEVYFLRKGSWFNG